MLKILFLIAALFWTGVILFFCLIKASSLPVVDVPNLDKIIHVFFHFVFTILWFLFLKKKLDHANVFALFTITVILSFLLGIGIELAQQFFTSTRQGDILDIAANLFGALLAVASLVVLNKVTGIVNKI